MNTKELTKKLKPFLRSIWGRKELGIDAIWILGITIVMTCVPSIYQQIASTIGRVLLVITLLMGLAGMSIFLVIRIIQRNKENPLTKIDYIHFILRSLIVMVCVWMFAGVMVGLVHPSLSGIYAIELSKKEKISVTLLNSLFFVLYSQAFITIFTGAGEAYSAFFKRLGKTWLITMLPMFLLSFLFTLTTQWMTGINTAVAYVLNVLFTTFLWVTSIALNERIKRG